MAKDFTFTKAHDLIHGGRPPENWLLEGILKKGSLSLLTAKPKVGKTTFALNLAVAVCRGDSFLERSTKQCKVCYLGMELKVDETAKFMADMQMTADDDLLFSFGLAPDKAVAKAVSLVNTENIGLLIVDTFQKLARVKDMNDYAQVSAASEPLLGVTRETDCHIMLLHHSKRNDQGEDAVGSTLGSTALPAEADTVLLLRKTKKGERILSGDQRYGKTLEDVVLRKMEDGSLVLADSASDVKYQRIWDEIELMIDGELKTEKEIIDAVGHRREDVRGALRWAMKEDKCYCCGDGKRNDPYMYISVPSYKDKIPEQK